MNKPRDSVLGVVLFLALEERNEHDHFAVCVKRVNEIIGHIPNRA